MFVILVYRPEADGSDDEFKHSVLPFIGIEILGVRTTESEADILVADYQGGLSGKRHPNWHYSIEEI